MNIKHHWIKPLAQALCRPEMVVFAIIIALAGLWFGLGAALLSCALALWVGWISRPVPSVPVEKNETAEDILNRFCTTGDTAPKTGCLIIGLDGLPELIRKHGVTGVQLLDTRIAERLRTALRETDCVTHLHEGRFAVLLAPTRTIRTETILQIAVRLQLSCEMPFDVNGRMITISLHCGGCPPERAPTATAQAFLRAATEAADQARDIGPGTIRLAPQVVRSAAVPPATPVLSAYFQPRINTSTGRVSGMMAIPRRLHRTPLSTPAEFSETLFDLSVKAVRFWNKNQLDPFTVALRLPPNSLHENGYLNRLIWEIDRQDMPADRFAVVIGNGMLTGPHGDRVQRLVRSLSQHGVRIELNDLDTAVMTTRLIRDLNVQCLRLPRTLTRNLHRNTDHQRMAAALITMADQLGVETAAEGISSLAELSLLAQLGCTHVGGPSVSPPLPLVETAIWVRQHESKLAPPPQIGIRPAE